MIKNKRTEGKIPTHYGMNEYYKSFKSKNPNLKINKNTYINIIEDFNKAIIDMVIEKNLSYRMPYVGSVLSVRKVKREIRIKDGKLINNRPIDWKATNKLWDEDEDAFNNKVRIRYDNYHTSGWVFKIFLKKYETVFKNKKYYVFKACRTFQRDLAKRINDETKEKYDAYLLY